MQQYFMCLSYKNVRFYLSRNGKEYKEGKFNENFKFAIKKRSAEVTFKRFFNVLFEFKYVIPVFFIYRHYG